MKQVRNVCCPSSGPTPMIAEHRVSHTQTWILLHYDGNKKANVFFLVFHGEIITFQYQQ